MKATVYTKNGFGSITKIEVHLHDVKIAKWAQYNNAVHVRYTKKRKKKASGFVASYNPYVVVVEGWNRLDPESMFDTVSESVHKSRYLSFDAKYCTNFDKLVDNGSVGSLVFDARYTKGYNPN